VGDGKVAEADVLAGGGRGAAAGYPAGFGTVDGDFVTVAADAAFRRMGMPEGLYPMAQATLYLATAPKSNSCGVAWQSAQKAVRDRGALEVPMKLRNAVTSLMKNEGYGDQYRYAHNEAESFARGETYLPEAIVAERFYEPSDRGYEKQIAARLAWLRGVRPEVAEADEKKLGE